MKCKKCIGAAGLPAVGHCSGCGAMIGRMSDKFCDHCSKTKNACAGCGVALSPANSQAGGAVGNTGDEGEDS